MLSFSAILVGFGQPCAHSDPPLATTTAGDHIITFTVTQIVDDQFSLVKYVLANKNLCSLHYCLLIAFIITNGPMNVTTCGGRMAEISCDYSGAPDPLNTRPDWRIIRRNNDGHVISNETVNAAIIQNNRTDGLVFHVQVLSNDSVIGRLSVGPVDDTYNNTSYQCIFTINDTIIASGTAGSVTVIGMYKYICNMKYTLAINRLCVLMPFWKHSYVCIIYVELVARELKSKQK